VLSLLSRGKTVICSLFLLTLFIYLFVFAQLVWLFKKPSFFSSFSSYFLFRCLCFALVFFLHILINILFFILIGFVVISMFIRKYEREKKMNFKGELSVIIMQYYYFLLFFSHQFSFSLFSLCVNTMFLVKLFCFLLFFSVHCLRTSLKQKTSISYHLSRWTLCVCVCVHALLFVLLRVISVFCFFDLLLCMYVHLREEFLFC
jgi:hypothetical protein